MEVHWFADYTKSIIIRFFYVRLQAVSFCSSESVEETQKSSGEAASESARETTRRYPSDYQYHFAARFSTGSEEQKETARNCSQFIFVYVKDISKKTWRRTVEREMKTRFRWNGWRKTYQVAQGRAMWRQTRWASISTRGEKSDDNDDDDDDDADDDE